MKGLPRGAFEQIVNQFNSDKYSKGYRSWDQLIAMVFAQLSGSVSLRELEAGFNSQASRHYHLGSRAIKRSTLADANARRDSEMFAAVCGQLMKQAHRRVRSEISDLLYLIDSTPIPLKGLGYDDWTRANHNQRTQGLKVHMMIAPTAELPVHAEITAPNVNDIDAGRRIGLETGATYVFDKGYCDYNWWYAIHQAGSYFVTRLKRNAGVECQQALEVPAEEQEHILADEVIGFKHKHPGGKRQNDYRGGHLRRIVIDRPDKDTDMVLVTNDFDRSANDIAELYKKRWGIELFFKWLKQNLKIKRFLGRSENAVKIQIYTALITYLLVELYRKRHDLKQSLKMCVAELKTGLFQRPELDREVAQKRRRLQAECQRLQGALAL